VSNGDILMKSITFYIRYAPLDLNELLSVAGGKVDVVRVIDVFSRRGLLQLIKVWLGSIQATNEKAVNEALNELYVDDGDYEALRHSIDSFNHFEAFALARKLEVHEALEFRRLASYIYRKQERWGEAIELSKKDKMYKDCIETAAESKSPEVTEQLMRYFAAEGLLGCFGAATQVCYDLIAPDLVLELGWKVNAMDYAMPFLIQTLKEQSGQIAKLGAQLAEVQEKLGEARQIAQQAAAGTSSNAAPAFSNEPFAASAPFGSVPPTGFGGQPGGFGPGPTGFASARTGSFGAPPTGGFGAPPPGFGAPPPGFGAPPAGFGPAPGGFGSMPAAGFGTGADPFAAPAGFPNFGPPGGF
jgi:clathrin heavy chain